MPGYVRNDLQSLIDFRNHLTRFNRTLEEEYRSISSDWRALGDVWSDDKYRQFGDALEEVHRGIRRYLEATADHEEYLRKLAERIKEYLDVR